MRGLLLAAVLLVVPLSASAQDVEVCSFWGILSQQEQRQQIYRQLGPVLSAAPYSLRGAAHQRAVLCLWTANEAFFDQYATQCVFDEAGINAFITATFRDADGVLDKCAEGATDFVTDGPPDLDP